MHQVFGISSSRNWSATPIADALIIGPLVARSGLLFPFMPAAAIRNQHIWPKAYPDRHIEHILPFYNKGVSQRANVDNKIGISSFFWRKLCKAWILSSEWGFEQEKSQEGHRHRDQGWHGSEKRAIFVQKCGRSNLLFSIDYWLLIFCMPNPKLC